MKVLVIGAGVLGSLYAARLQARGIEITMLARGERLQQLRTCGLDIVDRKTGIASQMAVRVVDQVNPDEDFDLAIIFVRKNQLIDLLPTLIKIKNCQCFLFMLNNASGFEEFCQALGKERVLLGFPGAGGKRDPSGKVTYSILPAILQATQIGELDGTTSPRLLKIAAMFRHAGFPTQIQKNMDAWLKTHVALVSPIANAIYLAQGDVQRLADTRDGLIMMIRAIREGFHVLDHLAIPVVPVRLNLIRLIPESILIEILKIVFKSEQAELVLGQHARSARDEMWQLGLEFQQLVMNSKVPSLNIDNLMRYVDSHIEPMPVGSRTIKVCWHGWTIALLSVLGFLLGLILVTRHRKV